MQPPSCTVPLCRLAKHHESLGWKLRPLTWATRTVHSGGSESGAAPFGRKYSLRTVSRTGQQDASPSRSRTVGAGCHPPRPGSTGHEGTLGGPRVDLSPCADCIVGGSEAAAPTPGASQISCNSIYLFFSDAPRVSWAKALHIYGITPVISLPAFFCSWWSLGEEQVISRTSYGLAPSRRRERKSAEN